MGKEQQRFPMKTALLAGGTGLVGGQLLQLLVNDSRYGEVKCLTRRDIPISHEKIKIIRTNGSNLDEVKNELIADDIYCCLGTTIKKARTKEAFRKIDFDYPFQLAKLCRASGAQQFLLVSALGANANAKVFYNKVKGEIEQAIDAIGYPSYHILRPSLLLGNRSEERSGEDAAKVFFRIFGFLVPLKYKGIQAEKVAKAMLSLAIKNEKGRFIHESESLQQY